MRRRWGGAANKMTRKYAIVLLLIALGAVNVCDAARRTAQRRKDTSSSSESQLSPSVETLSELAVAMGAAEFEAYTEGKALVKRLIPENSEPDLDLISHQGIIGKAGVDFPAFPNIPPTGFNCKNVPTGYYADLETDCQVFHICDTSRKISFLCPNGTIFSQSHLICDWWFKVDCASSPALYESSAEYYSNEQKKSQKITQSLVKNPDLQQINSDANNVRAPTPRKTTFVDPTPSTTERFLRHRQRLQGHDTPPTAPATVRSYQALFADSPRSKPQVAAAFEQRRKNLVQLIGSNYNTQARTTLPTYTDASTYRTSASDNLKEMQIAAESASFANSKNRQYLQDYNMQNFRPYPVYQPNIPTGRAAKPKTNPTLTTLFVFDNNSDQNNINNEATTKRPSLVAYTKSFNFTSSNKREPYTRPGVSLLKEYLEKKRNQTQAVTTERITQATARIDNFDQGYETATKIPKTTRSDSFFSDTASSDRYDLYSNTNGVSQVTTEPNYHERRERIMRRLNLESFGTTEPTIAITPTEKYGKRPGLIVPPSLTPKTLHSLAIYYATALDNLSTTQGPDTANSELSTTTPFDEYENIEEGIPALFSKDTIDKYSKLFAQGANKAELLEEMKLDANGTYNELTDDLSVQQSQNSLSSSPQLRELAQVFTHALSAYLQDPVKFRKVLSDIRPTPPSFADSPSSEENVYNTEATTTVNEEEEEILGFSDENKSRAVLPQFRESKAYTGAGIYPRISEIDTTTTQRPFETETTANTQESSSETTPKIPFKCCGRISASYTTASTPKDVSTTLSPYTNTGFNKKLQQFSTDNTQSTTENSYLVPRYGGFQNNTQAPNDDPYGRGVEPTQSKPLNEYVENTNLPTAWGVDIDATALPINNGQVNAFESKKIKPTTYNPVTTPVYFTETDSVEFENEEELQRAHSQSFVSPQDNNIQRQSKKIKFDNEQKAIKKPSEDLEAPTLPDEYETTTTQITTTNPTTTEFRIEETEAPTTASPEISSIFTSPDGERSTNIFQWSNNFENWHSTVVLDPLTLNDGLSATGPQQTGFSQLGSQTTAWAPVFSTGTTPTAPEYTGTSEQTFSSSHLVESATPSIESRSGRLLKHPTSTEANLDLTTIAETVVEKAKEIMGGEMNATTTEKLMNVMRRTKSKTVRRLILLLVQTCDDDHNSTAEASKRALLEALMTVSQKDMDEIEKEQENKSTQTTGSDYDGNRDTNDIRRVDKTLETQDLRVPKQRNSQRSGKSLNIDVNAINSLSNPAGATQSNLKNDAIVESVTSNTTPGPFTKTTSSYRRGARKFLVRTSPVEPKATEVPTEGPRAEARVAPSEPEVKAASDTRALELLRSLYTIAAKWG